MSSAKPRSMRSHHSAKSKTTAWLTPPEVLAALGPFDLDPCASMPRPWPTAKAHYYRPIDGLKAPWPGWCRIWMNPPYGTQVIGLWLQRLADHGRGTALIFASTETENFERQVWGRSTALLFLFGRLYFYDQAGRRAKANSGAPSVLCAYGQDDAEVLADCGLDGQFVPLLLPRFYAAAVMDRRWADVVGEWLAAQDGPAPLTAIYAALAAHPKVRGKRNWRAKVRQTLQRGGFRRVDRGVWAAGASA